MNILIVEDSPLLAHSLRQLVLSLGHRIAGVSASYEDAVGAMTDDVDLLLTDIMLTGRETGIDLACYIKQRFNIPVIFQSSLTDRQIIKDAMDTRPLAYLAKPVKHRELASALNKHLEHITIDI